MLTLVEIWRKNGQAKNFRVRFQDWNHRYRYFEILGFSSCGKKLIGTLETGEEISYPITSLHWLPYEEGDELCAKAV